MTAIITVAAITALAFTCGWFGVELRKWWDQRKRPLDREWLRGLTVRRRRLVPPTLAPSSGQQLSYPDEEFVPWPNPWATEPGIDPASTMPTPGRHEL